MLVRYQFYFWASIVFVCVFGLGNIAPHFVHLLWGLIPLFFLGLFDCFSRHNILRNYPIIGHLRFMLEAIRPEIQQYFIKGDLEGRPYNRQERSLIYQRAKGQSDVEPFGTKHDFKPGYMYVHHTLFPVLVDPSASRVTFGSDMQPYSASRLNISAMSFGALSARAIEALNKGAAKAGMYHNTGEGGISPYHQCGGDLVWQLGTGYFGCRDPEGKFSPVQFIQKAMLPEVKMIEIKLSQGAKPAHGGLLPKEKITKEIATIRGIPEDQDCHSPAQHSAFSTHVELLRFIRALRELSEGKPVGIKLCVGKPEEVMALCKAMWETKLYPDFITIDGAEGGTGAAPLEFTNRLGMNGDEGLAFVHNCLVGCGLRDNIRLISSAKIVSAFDIIKKWALGADVCNVARPMMFAVGCIQSLSCHNNKCPTGVATQDPSRAKAIDVKDKTKRVARFHDATLKMAFEMLGAMGVSHPDQLKPEMILSRMSKSRSTNLAVLYDYLEEGALLNAKTRDDLPKRYHQAWECVFGKGGSGRSLRAKQKAK